MALILSLDTAMENASLCLASGTDILSFRTNSRQMDHAAWVHKAIKECLEEAGKSMSDLQAVAVTSGPGSYTGLRVGMATAKGLCYALNIPLITESTLYLIATSAKREENGTFLICPMIDARRMEVFTALFDNELQIIHTPGAMILDENSFKDELGQNKIVFAGNGAPKWQAICHHPNAKFSPGAYNINDLALSATLKFEKGNFNDIAYTEPSYLKSVHIGSKPSN